MEEHVKQVVAKKLDSRQVGQLDSQAPKVKIFEFQSEYSQEDIEKQQAATTKSVQAAHLCQMECPRSQTSPVRKQTDHESSLQLKEARSETATG